MATQGYRGVDRPWLEDATAMGHHRGMTSAAEISSLSSTLQELNDRVTAMAETAQAQGNEDMAHELFVVERALGGALRRLRRFAQTA
jgi:hypothetical protein